MTLAELKNDAAFCERWPLVGNRLRKFMLARQHDFAREHSGNFEEIGRYVHFVQSFFDDIDQIDAAITASTIPQRPKLNNSVLSDKPPPRRPAPPNHGNQSTIPTGTK